MGEDSVPFLQLMAVVRRHVTDEQFLRILCGVHRIGYAQSFIEQLAHDVESQYGKCYVCHTRVRLSEMVYRAEGETMFRRPYGASKPTDKGYCMVCDLEVAG